MPFKKKKKIIVTFEPSSYPLWGHSMPNRTLLEILFFDFFKFFIRSYEEKLKKAQFYNASLKKAPWRAFGDYQKKIRNQKKKN